MSKSSNFNNYLGNLMSEKHNSKQVINSNRSDSSIFPLLKSGEIISYLKSKNIHIESTQISVPINSHITEVYLSLLCGMRIINRHDISNDFEDNSLNNIYSLHEKPLYLSKFYILSQDFITEKLRIQDYKTSDVFSPSEKRVIKILSGLIFACKIHDKTQNLFIKLKENSDLIDKNLIRKEEEFDNIKHLYNTTKESLENYKANADSKYPIFSKLNENINSCNNTIYSLEEKRNNFIEEIRMLDNELIKLESECNHLNKEIEVIKSKQVMNGELVEKVVFNLIELSNSMKSFQELIKSFNSEFEKNSLSIEELKSKLAEIGLSKRNIEAINSDNNDLNNNLLSEKDKILNLNKQISNKEIEIDKINQNLKELRLKKNKIEEEFTDEKRTLNNEIKKIYELISNCKYKYSDIIREKEQYERNKMNVQNEMINLQNSEKRILQDFEQKINVVFRMKDSFKNMIQKLID